MTNYQIAKRTLLTIALDAKSQYRNDKPAIRQIINDSTHEVCRDLDLSEYQQNLVHNYACELHPK